MPEYLMLKNTIFDNAVVVALIFIIGAIVILFSVALSVKLFKLIGKAFGYDQSEEIKMDREQLSRYLKQDKIEKDIMRWQPPANR